MEEEQKKAWVKPKILEIIDVISETENSMQPAGGDIALLEAATS